LESFFAIHHTGSGLLPEIVHFSSCDAHDLVFLRGVGSSHRAFNA
jgi:hypothetical protein